MRRWLFRIASALALGAAAGLAGLLWFGAGCPAVDGEAATDAIVVLTGGSLRLQSGLDLLAAGKARELFVSGVHQQVDLADLLRVSGNVPEGSSCCIVLGHDADNTAGNARETARWMRQRHYRSLRLVTSWYHMRRSLLEFERAMPEIAILPQPVFPDRVRPDRWWSDPGAMSLVSTEYVKYLATWVRPALDRLRPADAEPERETTALRQPP